MHFIADESSPDSAKTQSITCSRMSCAIRSSVNGAPSMCSSCCAETTTVSTVRGVWPSYLGFSIRAQIRNDALLSNKFETFRETVSVKNRCRHEVRRLGAGVAEHYSLVARSEFFALDNRLVDLFCLVPDRHHDSAGISVEPRCRRVVANPDDDFPHELVDIDVTFGLDFARHVNQPAGGETFDSNLRVAVLSEYRVQNCVGQLVAQFLRVSTRHRFAGKKS